MEGIKFESHTVESEEEMRAIEERLSKKDGVLLIVESDWSSDDEFGDVSGHISAFLAALVGLGFMSAGEARDDRLHGILFPFVRDVYKAGASRGIQSAVRQILSQLANRGIDVTAKPVLENATPAGRS